MGLTDSDRFDALLFRNAVEADPNFRWCTDSYCDAGQIAPNGGNSLQSIPQE